MKLSSVILWMYLELAAGVGLLHTRADLRRRDHYIACGIVRMVKVLGYMQRSSNIRRIRFALVFEQRRFLYVCK